MNTTVTFPYFFEENIIPGLPEGEYQVIVEVYYTPFVPACLTGHPDNWTEAEGGDWEIEEGYVQFEGVGLDLEMIDKEVYDAYMKDLTEESKKHYKDDYDPTPYCSYCGAMRKRDCKCGPIADNE